MMIPMPPALKAHTLPLSQGHGPMADDWTTCQHIQHYTAVGDEENQWSDKKQFANLVLKLEALHVVHVAVTVEQVPL